MYKYISLIVRVFCLGLSARPYTVFFLPSCPCGLLSAFLICPLFPLNSLGYFPRNTSAPFLFFFSSMSRLLILSAHEENAWHLLHARIYQTTPYVSHNRERRLVIAFAIAPQRNQRHRDYTSLLQLALSNDCVACICLFDNAYWQVPGEEQGKGNPQLLHFKWDGCIM